MLVQRFLLYVRPKGKGLRCDYLKWTLLGVLTVAVSGLKQECNWDCENQYVFEPTKTDEGRAIWGLRIRQESLYVKLK